jgi:hypothetical protein
MRGKINLNLWGIALIIMALALFSCKREKAKNELIPVAKVFKKTLYLADIQHIFPPSVSKQDSLMMAQSFIESWIKTQLLMNKAELNLTEEQLNITEQLEAYRSSLLIYKYEEQLGREKIDTMVTQEEVEKYYSANSPNFILDENIVKVLYIKIPLTAPDNENLKKLYKSDQAQDIKDLEKYCYTYSKKYTYFNEDWISFANVQKLLPQPVTDEDQFLKDTHFIEKQDKEFLYLVKINEVKVKGSVAPLVYVKRKVKDIILNKRKVKFISELEKNIYNDAADHSNFKIYNLDKK